jgi:Peptidase family C25/FlgD Ig-like domain
MPKLNTCLIQNKPIRVRQPNFAKRTPLYHTNATMNMKNCFTLVLMLLLGSAVALQAQSTRTFERVLNWSATPEMWVAPGGDRIETLAFEGCGRSDAAITLPLYTERWSLDGPSDLQAQLTNEVWEACAKKPHPDDILLANDVPVLRVKARQEGAFWSGEVSFCPIRQRGTGQYERLRSFTLVVRAQPQAVVGGPQAGAVGERNLTTSVLADGEVFKFGVSQTAVYKLDYTFLKNTLGITNLDQVNPRNIKIYGNGGFMLPELNSTPRPDDLLENAIFVSGEGDGRFDQSDYILFYATGPAPMEVRTQGTTQRLTIRQNLYDRHAWYFVKISGDLGLRVSEQPNLPPDASTPITNEMDDVVRLEDERENLLDWSVSHQGSGKRFYGDRFEQTRSKDYTLNFPNMVTPQTATVYSAFAARHSGSSTVRFTVDGKSLSASLGSTALEDNNAQIAAEATLSGTFNPDDDAVLVKVEHLASGAAKGWLDYIEVTARRRLVMKGDMMSFRDLKTMTNPKSQFQLQNAPPNLRIWDVTNRAQPRQQIFLTPNGDAQFVAETGSILREYIAFSDATVFPAPEATAGRVAAQNLHGLGEEEMVIVYHPDFEAAVQQLAQHRRDFNNLTVVTIPIGQVFNEFSSGGKDPVAIRDFVRMLYERSNGNFNYLLLFGDGSFDPKNNTNAVVNQDFVPVWETETSLSPIYAYPSDDFFSLLSPNEGGELDGPAEIAVGRIPCNTAAEADAVVRKIIAYEREPQTLGDWHLRLLYMADDDEPYHIDQAEDLSEASEQEESWFNVDKVYFDAYQRVATSSEKRIPDAKAAINANIFKGALMAQYIGHGGPRGWAQERVVDLADIAGWENEHKQPLFVTATCSFGGYDDYSFKTGGEEIILKANGGGIALFTTVRPVFIGPNDLLTDAVQRFIFRRDTLNNTYMTIGDILKSAKNTLTSGVEENARRFALLGDPAMRLAMPEYRIQTDSINGRAVSVVPDTLRSLQRARISGSVTDIQGNLLQDFNGTVYVTVFDKKQTLTTLALNSSPLRNYAVQRNVLFRGRATVRNGRFSVSFVLPKDLNYAFGLGKISYYAENGTPFDAAGADDTHLIIGGTSSEVADDTPPQVQAFLNTDAFVYGGITDDDPKILIKCADDNGMNVSGTSLGHDLTAVLDGNILELIVLNGFYESQKDDSRYGQAIYPLRNLAPGKHTLAVKGWDVANNSGEGYTEFVVAEDGKAALDHVLNYPNPFTTNTSFQFEHNLAGQVMDVQITILTISGRVVKTIQQSATPEGFRVTDIQWDGRDDYGDQLARGTYVYRVKVRGTDLTGQQVTTESDFERLVILK